MAEYTDNELLEMFRDASQRHMAFNLLVRKYQTKIYYFVRRMVVNHDDADDVVQGVFIKLWNNLDKFREDSQLFTWIYRIAVNESSSFLKSKKLRNYISLQSPEASLLRSLHADPYLESNEVQRRFQEAIIKLPEKQRIIFNMRYFDELSYEEISSILGTTVGGLKASYHHALKKVETSLTSH